MACNQKMSGQEAKQRTNEVKTFYGKTMKKSEDFQKICLARKKSTSKLVREAIALINEDVASRYYGCGLTVPELLSGVQILDLGCGSGMDCFALSKLVGEHGSVTGLDMTEELLEVARRNIDYHTKLYGYRKPNVDFAEGYMEDLNKVGLKDGSFDIVISNCVISLSMDKKAVFSEAYRVLKEGGEMYFSDIYVDIELPDEVRKCKELWGEGLSGCLYWSDFVRIVTEVGFSSPNLVSACPINVIDKEAQAIVGDAKYCSATYRLFKLPKERASHTCAIYQGGIPESEDVFKFDLKHSFPKGEYSCIHDEMATILEKSRFEKVFQMETSPECTIPGKTTKDEINPFQHLTCKQ